jgi:diguanylate cyclase (GGDEF)-like protein
MKSNTSSKVIGLDGYRATTEDRVDSDDFTRLALKLQQTLVLSPLLQTFCDETANIIPCDSVSYKNDDNLLSYQTGKVQPHRCIYELDLKGESLGHIEATRRKPFTVNETNLLEKLLSLLIYPLRNALLYQRAVSEARRDPLTQVNNRAAFDEALDRKICSYKRHNISFSLTMIDIDHFKKINDSYGHICGDSVLKSVADTLSKTVRRSDEVFRYGGEEFVVLSSKTELCGARFLAERLRQAVKQINIGFNDDIKITASFGLSASNELQDVNDILYQSDKALYQAKTEGRDKVVSHISGFKN